MAWKLAVSAALSVLPRSVHALHLQDEQELAESRVIIDSEGVVSQEPVTSQWGLYAQDDLDAFRNAVAEAENGVPVSEKYLAREEQGDELTSSWFSHHRFSLRFDPLDDSEALTESNMSKINVSKANDTTGEDGLQGDVAQSDYDPTPWEQYFNREVCMKHRVPDAKTNYFVWCQLDKPIIYSKKYNFAYMKTPKAASTAFFAYFKKKFDDAEEIEVSHLPKDAYIFTFVRRPFEQKLSAYAEVDLKQERLADYGKSQKTKFQDVPRGLNEGRDRFFTFLDDLDHRRFEQTDKRMPSHAASQIAGVLCTREVNFIGHLERATVDWEQIQKDAGLPMHIRSKAVPIVHEGEKPEYEYDEHVPLNPTINEKICSMYRSDFVCLGYTAPPECAKYGIRT